MHMEDLGVSNRRKLTCHKIILAVILNYNTRIPNFPVEQETQARGVCYLQLIENENIF